MSGDLLNLYNEIRKSIDEIDATLDSQVDSAAAGKRKITNELIEQHKGSWEKVAATLVEQIQEQEQSVQIGIYFGLIRELNKAFNEPLSQAVTLLVDAQPKVEVEKIDEATLATLSKTRSELYGKIKSLIDTAKQFGMDEGMEMPKKRTGKSGKRGPRAISAYSFEIEGTVYPKLKDVVEVYSQYDKVSELTAAIRATEYTDADGKVKKIDLTNPPERFEFTLPDGKVMVATRDEETEDDDDDEVSEEAETESDE